VILLALAAAASQPTAASFPELEPKTLLLPILAELKRTLADPYSVRDFTLCPADRLKLKDGKPVRFDVSFAFNAKNSFGGYMGVKTYAAVFRNGRISGGITATHFDKSDGISGLVNEAIARKVTNCPTVADELIQRLMSSGASVLQEIR
jgi:hypothetical protein